MDFGKLGRNFLLVDAIIRKQLHEVESLLNSGADIDFINFLDKNNTPLHYAAFADAPDIKEFLLSKGANPNSANDDGNSPVELNATGEDSSSQSVELDTNEPAFSATYIKRPGTSAISGQLYETKLLALALFRLVHDSQIPSFYLGTNLDEAGAFDDVVLRYRIGGRDRVLFLQAKHKEDCSKKIALKDLLDPDKTSGNFNLGKYFRSYLQIRYKFSANSASAVFNGDFEKTNAELILFTSAAMDTSLGSSAELVVKSEQTARTCLFYSVSRGNTISFEGFPKAFVKVASQWHFEAMAEVVTKRLMLSKKCEDLKNSVEQLLEDEVVLAKLKSLEDYCNEELAGDKSKIKVVVGILRNHKFHELSYTEQEYEALVEDFFSKLKIYTEQSTELEVERTVLDEIYKMNPKSVNNNLIFLKFHDSVQQWWKQTGDVPFRTKNCQLFKTALDEIEYGPVLQNIHNICMSRIGMFEVSFEIYPLAEVDRFMECAGKGSLNIFGESFELNCIKLVQYFEFNKWQFKFINIDYIGMNHLGRAIEKQTSCLLIAFDGQLSENVLKQIEKNVEKVIFLTKNEFKGQWKCTEHVCRGLTDLKIDSQAKIIESMILFQDIPVQVGSVLGEEKSLIGPETLWLLLQGDQIDLASPKSPSKHDDGINYYVERTLRLCTFKKSLLEDEQFFRVSSEQDVPESDSDRDIVVISNGNEGEVPENEGAHFDAAQRYEELCKQNTGQNIHLVRAETIPSKPICFVWLNSQGSVTKLRKHLDETSVEFAPASVVNDNELLSNSVVILAADPGMGKTTLLAALASKTKKAHPSAWVVRINLLDHTGQFRQLQKDKIDITRDEAGRFLSDLYGYSEGENRNKLFEKNLFQKLCDQRKLIILVDGFDEVSPDYNETVLQLLDVFRRHFASTLWVASRSGNIQYELEDHLGIFAHGLKPFTGNDTKVFLRKYWSLHLKIDVLDEDRFKHFTDKLMEQFKHSLDQRGLEFMSVPLQIKMIAIIFQRDFKAFHESADFQSAQEKGVMLDLSKDLIEVYEKFIEIKYDVLEAEKYQVDTSLPLNRVSHDRNFGQFIEKHKLIAVHTLFNQPELDLLLTKEQQQAVERHLDVVRNYEEKTGIIYHVVGEKALFVHMTYAEYFVAVFLHERCVSQQDGTFVQLVDHIFVQNLIEKNRTQICRFFQLKARRDMAAASFTTLNASIFVDRILNAFEKYNNPATSQLVQFVECCMSFEEWKVVAQTIVSQKSDQSKTCLLIQGSCEDCTELARIVIKTVQNVNRCIEHDNSTALHKASSRGHFNVVKMLLEHKVNIEVCTREFGFTALHFAVMNGQANVVELLLDHQANLKAFCRLRGFTALHWAIFQNKVGVVAALLRKGADANAPSRDARETPLYLASGLGRAAIVELLIGAGASVNSRTLGEGFTALQRAVYGSHTKVVTVLLSKGADVNAGDSNGWTPLHQAAYLGDTEITRILLGRGAYINVRNEHYLTPLMVASDRGHTSVVELLLQNGALVDFETITGWLAAHSAAAKGHEETVSVLLDHGSNIDAIVTNTGFNALHIAIGNSHTAVAELLLNRGIKVDTSSNDTGQTALMMAAERGYAALAKLLILKEASVHAQNLANGFTPLHYAVQQGHVETIVMLLEFKAKVDIPAGEDGPTPLFLAIMRGDKPIIDLLVRQCPEALAAESSKALNYVLQNQNVEMIELLLNSGADVRAAREGDGFMAHHVAAQIGNVEILILINEYQDYNQYCDVRTEKHGVTPLMVACANGHADIMYYLVHVLECDVRSATNDISWTSLHAAAMIGNAEVASFLLKSGAEINAATSSTGQVPILSEEYRNKLTAQRKFIGNFVHAGNIELPDKHNILKPPNLELVIGFDNLNGLIEGDITALHVASQNGHTAVVELLLTEGASVDARSMNGHTPLYLASKLGETEIIKLLLKHGADIASTTNDVGFTPLHIATQNSRLNEIELLLERGADIDARSTDNGRTPLMVAVQADWIGVVKLLVSKGANINANATTDNGSTALHLAAELGYKEIVSILLENDADKDAIRMADGFTPLHLACQNGHQAVVQELLGVNANVNVITRDGHTSKYLASVNEHYEIVDLLNAENYV